MQATAEQATVDEITRSPHFEAFADALLRRYVFVPKCASVPAEGFTDDHRRFQVLDGGRIAVEPKDPTRCQKP